jgi:hypothetical protein
MYEEMALRNVYKKQSNLAVYRQEWCKNKIMTERVEDFEESKKIKTKLVFKNVGEKKN